MKKLFALILAALLCMGGIAFGEEGDRVEILKIDGISVVELIPAETQRRARGVAEEAGLALKLPELLTLIEEEAFVGVAAERVELSGNVVAIEARAFAKCESLREIVVPRSVLKIDDTAFEGCHDVTVYGDKGTEAQRIANLYGFAFVAKLSPDPNEGLPMPLVLSPAPLR